MADKVVVYLDILGFSDYVGESPTGAIELLANCSTALSMLVTDQSLHPPGPYSSGGPRSLAEHKTASSFEQFLVLSDSVFVVSGDPSLLVFQLSNFLVECFGFTSGAYTHPEEPSDPRKVTVTTGSINRDGWSHGQSSESWYPALFRGGIAFGDVQRLEVPIVLDGRLAKSRNLSGKAVVEAANLEREEGLKGPRILCSKEFVSNLDKEARRFIGPRFDMPGSDETAKHYELYWPMAIFEEGADLLSCWDGFLRAAMNLWKFSIGHPAEVHYFAFAKLLVKSAMRMCPPEDARNQVQRTMADMGLHALGAVLCG